MYDSPIPLRLRSKFLESRLFKDQQGDFICTPDWIHIVRRFGALLASAVTEEEKLVRLRGHMASHGRLFSDADLRACFPAIARAYSNLAG